MQTLNFNKTAPNFIDLNNLRLNQGYIITIPLGGGGIHGCNITSADINGDGFHDIIIGQPGKINLVKGVTGGVTVVLGKEGVMKHNLNAETLLPYEGYMYLPRPAFQPNGAPVAIYERTGEQVKNLGDINGDGIDDLAILAPLSTLYRVAGTGGVAGNGKAQNINYDLIHIIYGKHRLNDYRPYHDKSLGDLSLDIKYAKLGNSTNGYSLVNTPYTVKGIAPVELGVNKINDMIAIIKNPNGAGTLHTLSGTNSLFGTNEDITSNHNYPFTDNISQVTHVGAVSSLNHTILISEYSWSGTPETITSKVSLAHSDQIFPNNPSSVSASGKGVLNFVEFYYGSTPMPYFYSSQTTMGDFNGDGYNDIIINVEKFYTLKPTSTSAQPINYAYLSSEVYIFSGINILFPSKIDLSNLLKNEQRKFVVVLNPHGASSVDFVNDLNGDGITDLVIGNQDSDVSFNDHTGFIIFGNKDIFDQIDKYGRTDLGYPLIDPQNYDPNGVVELHGAFNRIASGGDINGDGINDLLLAHSAPNAVNLVYALYGFNQTQYQNSGVTFDESCPILRTAISANDIGTCGQCNTCQD